MEVNKSYIQFLLQLLNNEEKIDIEKNQEGLIVNLYLTLLSLSNLEYSDDIDEKEKETISDFLRKLNNLKVKIQLKRKVAETNKLANELINQYYENINILSIYVKDAVELENVINTMDAKSLTKLIDKMTKDKMNKEDTKTERNQKRSELVKLLPSCEYHIDNSIIYIKHNSDNYNEDKIENTIETIKNDIENIKEHNCDINKDININELEIEQTKNIELDENNNDNKQKNTNTIANIQIENQNIKETKNLNTTQNNHLDNYEKITIEYFIDMFSYLLNPDNYKKTYKNKTSQKTHELIVSNIIKILLDNRITKEELNKILVPILLTYMLSLNINGCNDLDTSKFNIENIKINELYSFANQTENQENNKTTKWRNISIPNEYLMEKIREMIRRGMYYHKDDTFILEHIENNTSDFKISIKTEGIEQFLKNILEAI